MSSTMSICAEWPADAPFRSVIPMGANNFFVMDSSKDCYFSLFQVSLFLLWFDRFLSNTIFLQDSNSFEISSIFPKNLQHTFCFVKTL